MSDGEPVARSTVPATYDDSVAASNADEPRFTDWLRDELDALGPELAPRRRATVEQLFRRTVELEVAFFDAADTART